MLSEFITERSWLILHIVFYKTCQWPNYSGFSCTHHTQARSNDSEISGLLCKIHTFNNDIIWPIRQLLTFLHYMRTISLIAQINAQSFVLPYMLNAIPFLNMNVYKRAMQHEGTVETFLTLRFLWGCVHPLLDVALCHLSPSSSVFSTSHPTLPRLTNHIISPLLPLLLFFSSWAPLRTSYCPPVILYPRHMSSPFALHLSNVT